MLMQDLKARNRKLAGEVQRLKKELAAVRRQLGSCQLARASLEAAVASRHQQVRIALPLGTVVAVLVL